VSIDIKFNIKHGDFSLKLDLAIPANGVTALFGPSGCGKTSLLRAIAGLERHANGYLKVGDKVWQDGQIFIPTHQRPLAYVFQEASLFAHLNVLRNIKYGFQRISKSEHNIKLEQVIELLNIGHLLHHKPHTLSGGERQRVAIARALASSPKLLLMDEPMAALDKKLKQEILPYMQSLHQSLNIPIIYVSHSHDEVAQLADHLVLIDEGKVVATGPIHELFTCLDLPLAHHNDAEALIEATVIAHDHEYGLSYLDFPGGRFTVERKNLTLGHTARLRVAARDVSLTLEHQSNTSILNIFPAIVEEIVAEEQAHVTVRLLIENTAILSRITRKSAAALELHQGKKLYAQAKSVALFS